MIADEFDAIRRRLEEIWLEEKREPVDLGKLLKRTDEDQSRPTSGGVYLDFGGGGQELVMLLPPVAIPNWLPRFH